MEVIYVCTIHAYAVRFRPVSCSYRHSFFGLARSTTSATRSGGASIGSGMGYFTGRPLSLRLPWVVRPLLA